MKKIVSTTLVRVLAVVCGLFGCTLTGYAYYDEAIEANKDFYIYNVANGKYLQNNNGGLVLVDNITDASAWQFSNTSGRVTVKNSNHYLEIAPPTGTKINLIVYWQISDPGENAIGEVKLNTEVKYVDLSGDLSGGYSFSENTSYGRYGASKRAYYLSKNINCIYPNNSTSTKWKLISKRQVDNTISLPSSLTLDAIQGGDAVAKQFDINHNGAPTTITLSGSTSLVINSPAKPAPINVTFQVAEGGSKTITISDVNDASNKVTYSFDSSTAASVTLTVSTTAASGNAIEADKKTITITGNVVTLKEQYIDWTQNFTALTPTSGPIALNAVARTTGGTATGKTITYTLASTGVVKIVNNTLYVLAEGTTSIKASVAKDGTYLGAEKTLNVKVSGLLTTTITPTNATNTKLYTGTVGGPKEGTFYRGLTEVNLERCFANNYALFDTLYVFGVTMNTDGTLESYTGTDSQTYTNVPKINIPSASVGCNATTPCYVFGRSGVDKYSYVRTFDATKTRYDWESTQKEKHLYFTGYCPFAYMGVTPTAEGWMYFKGGNTTVDIYLDNCEIMGRYKTQTGKNSGYENYIAWLTATNIDGETPNVSFLSGSSSPFVFTSTTKNSGESYKPTIHIAGVNHLQGQMGSYISKVMGRGQVAGQEMTLDAGIKPVYTYNAPITIKPTDVGHKTDLVMTDIWKNNTVTNGYLKLDANKGTYSSEKVVAVDLGSANGSLTINGGQYHLRNSAADGTYACNLAVGYRVFDQTVERSVLSIPVKARLQLYGFGGDVADSKVIINSGTFTMYKNMYPNGLDAKGDTMYLGEGYYKDQETFLDLRLPAGRGESRINGGTFNGISNVLMCSKVTTTGASPKNGYGDWLCLQDVEVTGEKTFYGSDKFEIPEPFDIYDEDPQVLYDLLSLENKEAVMRAGMYGGQSANAYTKDDKQVVRLLLAGTQCEEGGGCTDCKKQEEAIIFQWATAIPKFDGTKNIGDDENPQWESVSVGGPDSVKMTPPGENIEYQTNQLLYVDCAGMEQYSINLVDQGATLEFNDSNMPRGQITNKSKYEILDHLNILKTVQADTWYAFTAPFFVHDVSVVETNEKTIDVKNRKRKDALRLQAEDNLKLFYGLQHFIIPTAEGRASSLTLQKLLGPDSSMPKRTRQPLTHYDGSNMLTANYYLYELDVEEGKTEFSTTGTRENLAIKWKPVKRNAGEPLMYPGKTYAIQFPYCPMCNDLDTRDYYDYWSNKLILFHGNGPQIIAGTNLHNTIVSDAMPKAGLTATLAGNSTLADMTLDDADNAYVHNMTNDYFELNNTDYTLKPTEGFMLYNPGSASMPARISRSGQMVYPDNTTTDVEDVPTISDRTSLMLFDAMDGIEILSLSEQVVMVYNLQGNLIFRQQMTAGEQIYVATGSGIFVVRGESETIKVMVD